MKKSLGARTLTLLNPVWVIGTYDKKGNPNLMTAAWVGICCSKPPCLNVSLRKATYSYRNIVKKKAFTVNIPPEAYVKESDYIGIVSGRELNKFSKLKLTPIKSKIVDAPYVKEFPLALECKLIRTIKIGLHTEFIVEIIDVKADTSVLNSKGLPDLRKVKPFLFLFEPRNSTYIKVGAKIGKAFSIGKSIQRAH